MPNDTTAPLRSTKLANGRLVFVSIHYNGGQKTELLDGRSQLVDLLLTVRTRVARLAFRSVNGLILIAGLKVLIASSRASFATGMGAFSFATPSGVFFNAGTVAMVALRSCAAAGSRRLGTVVAPLGPKVNVSQPPWLCFRTWGQNWVGPEPGRLRPLDKDSAVRSSPST
jgi:hypothetical protein